MSRYLLIGSAVSAAVLAVGAVLFLPVSAEHLSAEADTPPLASSTPVRLLFVGDIMFDRGVADRSQDVGDGLLFAGVQNLFSRDIPKIGNLEGTITTLQSISRQNHAILNFTFDPHYAKFLSLVGFTAVNLANNHSSDFGKVGYDQTVDFLTAAGVASFGSSYNDQRLTTKLLVQGKSICLVGYHGLFKPDPKQVIVEIRSIRDSCDYVLVMTHWGVEYQHEPTQQQRDFGHAFIDAGADAVIGSHPHVVQPLEIYKNKAIFYSLGNFLFDQEFSPDVSRGLAVEAIFSATSTRFDFIPVRTVKNVSIADPATSAAVLNDLGVITHYIELTK